MCFPPWGSIPVCPGSNNYQIGSPLFKQVDVHLDKMVYPGGKLVLKTNNNSDRNLYIHSILVDGMPYKKAFFDHQTLVYEKTILFNMDNDPQN